MPQVGSPSFLANMATRRRTLNRVREALFDRPGIQRRGGPPPPTVPANRPNPQQQALEEAVPVPADRPVVQQQAPNPALDSAPGSPVEAPQPGTAGGSTLPPEVREQLLAQISEFLDEQVKSRRATLHRKIGRARRFFGGGV